jgi:predicted ATP-dependent protease
MSEKINDKIVHTLNSNKTHEEAVNAVRALVEELRRKGEQKETLLSRMQELRGLVSSEQEGILLEVMDFLVGYCSPHAKIE